MKVRAKAEQQLQPKAGKRWRKSFQGQHKVNLAKRIIEPTFRQIVTTPRRQKNTPKLFKGAPKKKATYFNSI